jgi:tRNA(fMet)-specific endonuclease VapC
MIRYLLDANIALYAMDDGHEKLTARIGECVPGEIGFSAISYAEVAYGTYVGKPPPADVLEAFVAAIPIVAFDEVAAREYAKLPFKRTRFDRLLAAHALSIGAVVVTHNADDFVDVAGLVVEDWTV